MARFGERTTTWEVHHFHIFHPMSELDMSEAIAGLFSLLPKRNGSNKASQ
uniref:Uncharacterized protein n=1 Tax=Yersinia ruckeri TaxID=29486 RepID=A0A0A8VNW1_YERRU|nr:hypothetical protein CSF007_17875 [Yersinia ruckeri]